MNEEKELPENSHRRTLTFGFRSRTSGQKMQNAGQLNDHIIVSKRKSADIFGSYLTQLLKVDTPQECMQKLDSRVTSNGKRGCNSEMMLKFVMDEEGVRVRKPPQSLIPFLRSARVEMPARTLNGTESERKRSCSCEGTGAGGPQSLTKALCRVYLTGNSRVIPLSGMIRVVNKDIRLPLCIVSRSHLKWATYWMEMDD